MADLNISKRTISQLFGGMQNRKFVIPDFQRPYKWDKEKCETLWDDIESFCRNRDEENYFLGTVVSSINSDNNLEIIDGQQRITSIFLMLRAFYKKLESMLQDDEVVGLQNQIAPCIWDVNLISLRVSDKCKIHIQSLVATEQDNESLHKILETGEVCNGVKDNYSNNFKFFIEKSSEYAEQNPLHWKELCVTILHRCIILPVECNTQDTALTIFSTLNDRGMPLIDSDIFKAQIYRHYLPEKRKDFTDQWRELTQVCDQAGLSVDDIFRYYTHVLRARNDDKSREIGLRKFYAQAKYGRLRDENLMSELMNLAEFWRQINTVDTLPDEDQNYVISTESRKYLHCLSFYPNEYWKYPVSVFFLKNVGSTTFDMDFTAMLKKLVAFLFYKFIENPTVNAIKDIVFEYCITLNASNVISTRVRVNEEIYTNNIGNFANSKLSRALMLLNAYLHPRQSELIPRTFDIEHILPRRWQTAYYKNWSRDNAEVYLEKFGNKIVLEKKLNIQAGDGYFGKKKTKYAQSKISSVQDLAKYPQDDWIKEDIESREARFIDSILRFFKENLESV